MRSFLPGLLAASSLFAQTAIPLRVDATDAPRRVFHVQITMPAKPGPMTLLYPEWIPGDHMPDGPLVQMVGLVIKSGGQTVVWKRDSVNMFAFHVDVPAGATALDIAFDFLSPPDAAGTFASGSSATTELAVLNWNQFVLYPLGVDADKLQYQANLKVPDAWKYGTALPIRREAGNEVEFQPASLTTLIDSPVSAGKHYRTVDLGTDRGAPHFIHIAADSDRALEAPAETIAAWKNLVAETGALFGSRHYRDYHFLLTLSDHVAHFGLEHHESSDDRVGERTLVDSALRDNEAYLLTHEFTHSWNGKYRRPTGLVNGGHDGGYDVPMKGDLLWVYEGLTNYLGEVLAPRSGLWTPEQYRDSLARTAASLDNSYGRRWRPLEDTAVAAQTLYNAIDDYADYRRSVDYYPEGSLIWLDADVLIRQKSNGSKSLNDFCRAFHGGPGGAPALKTYTFEDVMAGLNAVQPYDWAGFFNQRLHSTSPHAPLGGIENGGWKLVYDATRSELWKDYEEADKVVDLSYSIGIKVKDDDATIVDISYGGPARAAGISPSVKLIAVNNRQYTSTVLREAVQATAAGKPLELLIKNGEYFEMHRIDYHGGERYPHLVRDAAKPDILSEVTAPLVKH
ncbi:Glycyl aminopeptidase. Metallo peptidase. MEROPS family M61 [Candidatus Sulfopaludibacter sp. SbA3]|nr:Glycyl aminopeptidase. Metallo peptidase. MEROPS family M61 [Candidatus Sulfopaludibacter sp. SbA3]